MMTTEQIAKLLESMLMLDTSRCPTCKSPLSRDRGFPVFCSGECRDTIERNMSTEQLRAWFTTREQMIAAAREKKHGTG